MQNIRVVDININNICINLLPPSGHLIIRPPHPTQLVKLLRTKICFYKKLFCSKQLTYTCNTSQRLPYKNISECLHLSEILYDFIMHTQCLDMPTVRFQTIITLNMGNFVISLTVFVGDFNSLHMLWKYRNNGDTNREILMNWVDDNNTYLVFHTKQQRSFKSVAWNQEYNPDLRFVSKNYNNRRLRATRRILADFPHSQH